MPNIVLNDSENRFQIEDNEDFYVEFEVNGDPPKMNIIDTVASRRFRDALLCHAFDYADEKHWDVETTCDVAADYVTRNPSRGQPIPEPPPAPAGPTGSPVWQNLQQLFYVNRSFFMLVLLFVGLLDRDLFLLLSVVFLFIILSY
ncbi:PREDICTED: uncharacterized protein LOC101308145 [Fragaria vesca subsp. vesca]|uniref:uncharacterized protein LOC101308145 n=1 Tax=Fragaria vesca subsp. vesca TaxID=101020 RepID=UPI0002C362E9|nr:PREDICTED: uncharacterized protein LOC101308145 [Fragaria vesca subsp. vesca]